MQCEVCKKHNAPDPKPSNTIPWEKSEYLGECPTKTELNESRASDILRSDVPIVHAAEYELVGGVSGQVGDLDCVVDLVVYLAIRALRPGDLAVGDAAEICFDTDELGHAFCRAV